MSIIRCEKCERNIDTDYDEYFNNDIEVCEDCTPEGVEDE
tara:strand:- start:534 stop:653 length:120 start_codon:yes stop_codon:yes gene_type:complete